MEICRRAAKDWIDDATAFDQSNNFERSFVLYFCAAEQLAKFYTLELAGRRIYRGEPVDWPTCRRKLSSHDRRIGECLALPEAFGGGADLQIKLSATRTLALRMLADAETFGPSADAIERELCHAARNDDLAIVANTVVYALEQARKRANARLKIIRYLDKIGSFVESPRAVFGLFSGRVAAAATERVNSLSRLRGAREPERRLPLARPERNVR